MPGVAQVREPITQAIPIADPPVRELIIPGAPTAVRQARPLAAAITAAPTVRTAPAAPTADRRGLPTVAITQDRRPAGTAALPTAAITQDRRPAATAAPLHAATIPARRVEATAEATAADPAAEAVRVAAEDNYYNIRLRANILLRHMPSGSPKPLLL